MRQGITLAAPLRPYFALLTRHLQAPCGRIALVPLLMLASYQWEPMR